MAEQDAASGVDLYQVAHIVSSYVRHHQIGPDQLVRLIVEVYQARANLRRGAPPVQEPRKPAVPIRRFGAAGLCGLPRVRVSCADASPTSAGRP